MYRSILKKIMCSGLLVLVSSFAAAKPFSCPSVEELQKFEGVVIEYPLSLDTQSKEPNSWMVGQVRANRTGTVVDTLLISPVRSTQGETALDSAEKLIPNFQAYQEGVTDGLGQIQAHLCVYWSPIDGSLGSFLHVEDERSVLLSPMQHMNMAVMALAKLKNHS